MAGLESVVGEFVACQSLRVAVQTEGLVDVQKEGEQVSEQTLCSGFVYFQPTTVQPEKNIIHEQLNTQGLIMAI